MSITTKIILAQLGSPASPSVDDVRIYLKRFLSSRRVVDLPWFLWWPILNLFVLPFRSKISAGKYLKIWDGKQFPLVKYSEQFARGVEGYIRKECKLGAQVSVESIYLLPENGFKKILEHSACEGSEKLLVVPMFPQFAESTTLLVMDSFHEALAPDSYYPRIEILSAFYDQPWFISSCVNQIELSLKNRRVDHLLLSFHSVPLKQVVEKKDPYHFHCQKTFELIQSELVRKGILSKDLVSISFQSRFGKGKWLGPSTLSEGERLVSEGKKVLAVFAPSFVVDCLETLGELRMELSDTVKSLGGELVVISSLNDDPLWIENFSKWVCHFS